MNRFPVPHRSASLALIGLVAAAGHAQVVINEVLENTPGSGSTEPRYEYIELYGAPNLSLDGYLIALAKGGSDPDGNDIPNAIPELDEVFSLDGLSLGPNGLLVIYNDTGDASFIPSIVTDEFDPATPVAGWDVLHVPSIDTPGNLSNDDSSSYILMRRRPMDPSFQFGTFWRKDVRHDPGFTGKVSFGPPNQPGTPTLDPYQMVDDVAWSNNGGKEYVRSSQQEISNTPGFNPDAIARANYFGSNPMLGSRFNSAGAIVETRTADEEWIYGEITDTLTLGFDETRSKGPTDLARPGYDGTCNPEDPDVVNCNPNGGPFLFDDIDITGFALTPGGLNDGGFVTQFRFVTGDINFDGVANIEDYYLLQGHFQERLGTTPAVTLDEMEPRTFDNDTPGDPTDDFSFLGWRFEGRAFNGVLAMMQLDTTDDTTGGNATFVTAADILAGHAIYCAADISSATVPGNPDGVLTGADFFEFLSRFSANDLRADYSSATEPGVPDGVLTGANFFFFLNTFQAGC